MPTSVSIPHEHEQRLLWDACSFRKSAKLIIAGSGGSIPFVVCYCFALELIIKLLIGKSGGGHDIDNLYSQLPIQTRDLVEAFHNQKPRFPAEQLLMRLKRIGNAFEVWRYAFEDAVNGKPERLMVVEDLDELWEALFRAVSKLKPGLTCPEHLT